MRLKGTIVERAKLSEAEVIAMLALMQKYYLNVTTDSFTADLNKKESVILLKEGDEIKGFSTQMLFDFNYRGETLKILFSGDTIIDEKNRNSRALPLTWGRMMLRFRESFPDHKLYWLLTSKGYKTYRFLSVFFKEFYPCYKTETPDYDFELLTQLGERLFGDAFVPGQNILLAKRESQRLRIGVADVTEGRITDPHIAFFVKKNPNHAAGEELVCLARFEPENLNQYIRQKL